MTLCDKAGDQATEAAAEPTTTMTTMTLCDKAGDQATKASAEPTTTMTTAVAATSALGAGTYDGEASACAWCGALSEPAFAAELAAMTRSPTSTAAETAALIKIAQRAEVPCLDLTSSSSHIKWQDQGTWHLSAIGHLKMGRTADTKEITRGLTSTFLHYLCVDDFSRLDWGCVQTEVYESVHRFEEDLPNDAVRRLSSTMWGPELLITDLAVRYDPSWALFSAKQDEVARAAGSSDWPSDRGYILLYRNGLNYHPSNLTPDDVVPGLSALSDGVRQTFRHLAQVTSGWDVSWTYNLWFVDYDIRRVAGEARLEKRQECRTAAGTFVEVERGDAGWDFSASSSHRLAESLMEVEDVITFMRVLKIEMSEDDDENSWVSDTSGVDWQDFLERQYVGPKLGVLAWEPGTCDTSGGIR